MSDPPNYSPAAIAYLGGDMPGKQPQRSHSWYKEAVRIQSTLVRYGLGAVVMPQRNKVPQQKHKGGAWPAAGALNERFWTYAEGVGMLVYADMFVLDFDHLEKQERREFFERCIPLMAGAPREVTGGGVHVFFVATEASHAAFPYKVDVHQIDIITVTRQGTAHNLEVAPSGNKRWVADWSLLDVKPSPVPEALVELLVLHHGVIDVARAGKRKRVKEGGGTGTGAGGPRAPARERFTMTLAAFRDKFSVSFTDYYQYAHAVLLGGTRTGDAVQGGDGQPVLPKAGEDGQILVGPELYWTTAREHTCPHGNTHKSDNFLTKIETGTILRACLASECRGACGRLDWRPLGLLPTRPAPVATNAAVTRAAALLRDVLGDAESRPVSAAGDWAPYALVWAGAAGRRCAHGMVHSEANNFMTDVVHQHLCGGGGCDGTVGLYWARKCSKCKLAHCARCHRALNQSAPREDESASEGIEHTCAAADLDVAVAHRRAGARATIFTVCSTPRCSWPYAMALGPVEVPASLGGEPEGRIASLPLAASFYGPPLARYRPGWRLVPASFTFTKTRYHTFLALYEVHEGGRAIHVDGCRRLFGVTTRSDVVIGKKKDSKFFWESVAGICFAELKAWWAAEHAAAMLSPPEQGLWTIPCCSSTSCTSAACRVVTGAPWRHLHELAAHGCFKTTPTQTMDTGATIIV